MGPSDFGVALLTVVEWRSVTTASGAQCVMMRGDLLMLKWLASSWDSLKQVLLHVLTYFIYTPFHTLCTVYTGRGVATVRL